MAKKAHVVGSGNVFADLGHPRPAEALAKAELAEEDWWDHPARGGPPPRRSLEVDQPLCAEPWAWLASRWTVWCGSWCCWK